MKELITFLVALGCIGAMIAAVVWVAVEAFL